jgi:hypothetical protein
MHLITPAIPTVRKYRTITFTNCAPIRIVEDEWPVITQGDHSYEVSEAPVRWKISIRVQAYHEDQNQWNRRVIIHANYRYTDDDKEERQDIRVGRHLSSPASPADLWKHMAEVAEELRIRIDRENMRGQVTHALDNCFANLKPLERLD